MDKVSNVNKLCISFNGFGLHCHRYTIMIYAGSYTTIVKRRSFDTFDVPDETYAVLPHKNLSIDSSQVQSSVASDDTVLSSRPSIMFRWMTIEVCRNSGIVDSLKCLKKSRKRVGCPDKICLILELWFVVFVHKEKKEKIWLSPMTKAHTSTEKSKKLTIYFI